MERVLIYFVEHPNDRWFRGDHKLRAPIRRLLRGPDPIGGIKRVYLNLCKGLDLLGTNYVSNLPFSQIRPSDLVGVVGLGPRCLEGYRQPNPILAGVAVAAHPYEWPSLFDDYPVESYVVHSEWVKRMYERFYGPRVCTWAVGIETQEWAPSKKHSPVIDVLVYDKVRWDHDRVHRSLVNPILDHLKKRGLKYELLTYGKYLPADYKSALARSRAMLFMCEHETQGLAYQQALSSGVPVLAWDPGQWLDPWRFQYGESFVPATSVPFFDHRCGMTFVHLSDFEEQLDGFMVKLKSGNFCPREYVLENLSLEGCATGYLKLLNEYCAV